MSCDVVTHQVQADASVLLCIPPPLPFTHNTSRQHGQLESCMTGYYTTRHKQEGPKRGRGEELGIQGAPDFFLFNIFLLTYVLPHHSPLNTTTTHPATSPLPSNMKTRPSGRGTFLTPTPPPTHKTHLSGVFYVFVPL